MVADGERSFVETVAHDVLSVPAYRAAESPFPAAVFAAGDLFFSAVDDSAGWMAITAKDGIEAMEILQSGAELPSIILSDVEMPRMDGYGLVSTIRKTAGLSHIPLVFITSRAGEKHRQKAAELGIDEYLTKPFANAELIETVERLTDLPTLQNYR